MFKVLSNVHKNLFRKLERTLKKQNSVQQHLNFILKDMYIFIYAYAYISIYGINAYFTDANLGFDPGTPPDWTGKV